MDEPPTHCVATWRHEWRLTATGALHRKDGPAVVYTNGSEEWWLNGKMHREGGPAVIYKCGYTVWYKHCRPHCTSGPARIQTCGLWHSSGHCLHPLTTADPKRVEWHVDGRQFTEDEFYRYVDIATGEVFVPVGRELLNDHIHLPRH